MQIVDRLEAVEIDQREGIETLRQKFLEARLDRAAVHQPGERIAGRDLFEHPRLGQRRIALVADREEAVGNREADQHHLDPGRREHHQIEARRAGIEPEPASQPLDRGEDQREPRRRDKFGRAAAAQNGLDQRDADNDRSRRNGKEIAGVVKCLDGVKLEREEPRYGDRPAARPEGEPPHRVRQGAAFEELAQEQQRRSASERPAQRCHDCQKRHRQARDHRDHPACEQHITHHRDDHHGVEHHEALAQHEVEADIEQERQHQHPQHQRQQHHFLERAGGILGIDRQTRFGQQRDRVRAIDPHQHGFGRRGDRGQRQAEHRAGGKGASVAFGKALTAQDAAAIERIDGDRLVPRGAGEEVLRHRPATPVCRIEAQPRDRGIGLPAGSGAVPSAGCDHGLCGAARVRVRMATLRDNRAVTMRRCSRCGEAQRHQRSSDPEPE